MKRFTCKLIQYWKTVQSNLLNKDIKGTGHGARITEVSELYRSKLHGFVAFGTENCVRIIEVYISRGSTITTKLIQMTQCSLLSKKTITLFIKQTIQYTKNRSCGKKERE